MNRKLQKAKLAVLTVGDGRGFVVKHRHGKRLVITAAHCLPFFPPCCTASYLEELTYKELLAPLGGTPSVWAECLFANPVADLAVLGSPDNQELFKQAGSYEQLVESIKPIPIADTADEGQAWLLSLAGKWQRHAFQVINDGPLWISENTGTTDPSWYVRFSDYFGRGGGDRSGLLRQPISKRKFWFCTRLCQCAA